MVAEQFDALSQIHVKRMTKVPGLSPAWDYNIDRSRLEIISGYLNSKAPGGLPFMISNHKGMNLIKCLYSRGKTIL